MYNKSNTGGITISVVIVFTVINLYIFGFSNLKNLTDQHGLLGDFINGLSAPIIGIITTVMLVLTLKAQMDTTKAQIEFNKEAKADKLLDFLHDSFNETISQMREREYTSQFTIVGINSMPYYKRIYFDLYEIQKIYSKHNAPTSRINGAFRMLSLLSTSSYIQATIFGLHELVMIQKELENHNSILDSSKSKSELIKLRIRRKTQKEILIEIKVFIEVIDQIIEGYDYYSLLAKEEFRKTHTIRQLQRLSHFYHQLNKMMYNEQTK
jgi:uncharacterized membrane protein